MNDSFVKMSNFMSNNKLKLNDDKTHLLLVSTKQRLTRIDGNDVTIKTPGGDIKPIKSERLLGVQVQDDLKWSEYLVKDKKSLVSQLSTRLSALKLISQTASFKSRLLIANGIFCSKLIYQISLWGGAASYLIDILQRSQNRAARFVTKRDKYTPVAELLKECGWLSVRQLDFLHSTVLVHKTLQTGSPKYLFNRFTEHGQFPYPTRLAASETIRIGPAFTSRLSITEKSFVNRGMKYYNSLPAELRKLSSLSSFKPNLRNWIQDNV